MLGSGRRRMLTASAEVADQRLGYLNNRYYDPTVGVFLSVDPLVSSTGDPYLYANGNPTTLRDPGGLAACSDDGNCPWLDQNKSSHDRFVDSMWNAYLAAAGQSKEQMEREYGPAAEAGGELSIYRVNQAMLTKFLFVEEAARSIAGLTDLGNGVLLLPEADRTGWSGRPVRDGDLRTHLGTSGWRKELVDDVSPEGHLIGYFALAWTYGETQTKNGLQLTESNAGRQSDSKQDYHLGIIAIDAAGRLASSEVEVGTLIRSLDAATGDPSQGQFDPVRVPPDFVCMTRFLC